MSLRSSELVLKPPTCMHFYEFGEFRIDPEERVLLRNGAPVSLPPKVFDTLLALVERSGHIVEKDELIQQLWPDTFVEENNLSQYISALRKALGDGRHEQRYIETVPRRGYRFLGGVREVWEEQEQLVEVSRTKMSLRIQEESETSEAIAVRSSLVRGFSKRKLTIAALAVLPLAIAVFVAARSSWEPGPSLATKAQIKTLAVLPLKTEEGEDQFLGLSIADHLISRFGQSLHVQIRPTSSIYKYLGANQDAVTAGRELQIDGVIAGEVKRTNERILVTLRLLNTRDGATLWETRFESDLKDLLIEQEKIVDRAAREVFSVPASSLKTALAKRHTVSAEAHQAYVRGRYYWNDRTAEGLHRSVTFFEQAIRHDPNYALAFAGLADAYAFDHGHWRQAEATARKALALDPALGEPHATIGFVRWFWLWDWQEAEREFQLAVALSPEYATAHQWYALSLASRFYFREARTEVNRALELDPFSLSINADLGQILYFMEDYDAAIEQCRRTLGLNPNFINAHAYLFQAYTQKGLYDEALAAYFKLLEISSHPRFDAKHQTALRTAYSARGIRGFWQEKLRLHESFSPEVRDHYVAAENHARLGDKEKALQALNRAIERRMPSVLFARVNPVFKGLYKDPRFVALMERVGKWSRKESATE